MNPILMGQAVEISESDLLDLTPEVRRMLDLQGIYICGDTERPEYTVPVISQGGKLFSVAPDQALDPERFKPTVTVQGPYRADVVAPRLGKPLFSFATFDDWVQHASGRHSRAGVCAEQVLAVDARGRICRLAKHYITARDDGAFPVVAYLVREDEEQDRRKR